MKDLPKYIENTFLKHGKDSEFKDWVYASSAHQFRGLCIAPEYKQSMYLFHADAQYFRSARDVPNPQSKLVTVVDFPVGNSPLYNKLHEVNQLMLLNWQEVDIVLGTSVTKLKHDRDIADYVACLESIRSVNRTFKYIIEIEKLSEWERGRMLTALQKGGVEWVKSSTGTVPGTFEDKLAFLKQAKRTHPELKVKISGGIQTLDQVVQLIDNGVDSIGTSNGLAILSQQEKQLFLGDGYEDHY